MAAITSSAAAEIEAKCARCGGRGRTSAFLIARQTKGPHHLAIRVGAVREPPSWPALRRAVHEPPLRNDWIYCLPTGSIFDPMARHHLLVPKHIANAVATSPSARPLVA